MQDTAYVRLSTLPSLNRAPYCCERFGFIAEPALGCAGVDLSFSAIGRPGGVVEAAKRMFSGFGRTEHALIPMERIELDEWLVDVLTLIRDGPIGEGIDPDTLERIGTTRRWVYVAIDTATRCIVGFRIAATQNSASAVRTLEMVTLDKTALAEAAGCTNTWPQGSGFQSAAADTGSAFRAELTLRAVLYSGAAMQYPNVGEPQLRKVIERGFGTFCKRLMPYMPGRVFSNPSERGDYDSEGMACLTDDDLTLMFVRYIVDVYHQTPHRGLSYETPADAWERMAGTVGTPPQLSPVNRRRAFGLSVTRRVTQRGVRFLNIYYNSQELMDILRHSEEKDVSFYVCPHNLGAISVFHDEAWVEVPCSIENFNGVTLLEWLEVGKTLRARYQSQSVLRASEILLAIDALRQTASDAMTRKGVQTDMPSQEDLDRIDRERFWGLPVIENDLRPVENLERSSDSHGYVIGPTNSGATGGEAPESDGPDRKADKPASKTNHRRKIDPNWWRGEEDQ